VRRKRRPNPEISKNFFTGLSCAGRRLRRTRVTIGNDSKETSMSNPSKQLSALDRLVGKWQVTGGATGTVTYEWVVGGAFLLQHVDLVHGEERVTGFEVIGHLQPFGGERSEHVHSRFYGGSGETYDYELEGDELTIWGGEKGSPAYFRGTFDDDGSELAGAWVYPGGGYEATMRKLT
jgi:hypothetical protein